jgi:outer membrane protein
MKYIISFSISLLFVCFINSTNGQTAQGRLLLGGETNLNFSSLNDKWESDDGNEDTWKTTNIWFSPRIGLFIADGLALGVELPISYSYQKYKDLDEYSSNSIEISPFIRYYFGSSKIKPYLNGKVGFGKRKSKSVPASGDSHESSSGMFSYKFGGGLGIFITENVSLDIGLGYSYISYKPKEDNDTNFKSIRSGFGSGIGIIVLL